MESEGEGEGEGGSDRLRIYICMERGRGTLGEIYISAEVGGVSRTDQLTDAGVGQCGLWCWAVLGPAGVVLGYAAGGWPREG